MDTTSDFEAQDDHVLFSLGLLHGVVDNQIKMISINYSEIERRERCTPTSGLWAMQMTTLKALKVLTWRRNSILRNLIRTSSLA